MALTATSKEWLAAQRSATGPTPSRGTTRDILPPHTGHEKQLAARVSGARAREALDSSRVLEDALVSRDGRPALLNARDDANGRDAAGDAGVEPKLLTLAMRIATAARGQAHGRGA